MAEKLSGWTPKTEHLLFHNCGTGYDIIDHALEASFPLNLLNELRTNGWIGGDDERCGDNKAKRKGRLVPARTALDVNLQSFLGGFLDSVRGDESAFISREERSRSDFSVNYPFLHRFISCIESTVTKDDWLFQQHFEFDTSQTSVQLATYSGDGKSGYPRHCDRGMTCTQEGNHSNSDDEVGKMQRLLTFVYYLTPSDWDDQLDGGALRMFLPEKNDDASEEANNNHGYFDVTPHSGRMVVFRSDVMEHEVMPSKRRDRIAITVWLYGRQVRKGNDKLVVSLGKDSAKSGSGGAITIFDNVLPPPLPIAESINQQQKEATIFVAIPSYRDIETFPTIKSLIETSNNPQRIYIGVVFQIDTSSNEEIEQFTSGNNHASCFKKYRWNQQTNLRTITIDHRHATGPCYARHLAQSLHRGEQYILQIDSHMRFRPGWDDYLIHQLNQCQEPSMSVLTTYPPNYDPPHGPGSHAETLGTILVPWKFDDKDGMLRQKGRFMNNVTGSNQDNSNIPCLLFAAGFNFSHSSLLELCPYDGKLHGLFFGEEISMAVRLFTNGVDLFAPPETVCYHKWKRNPLREKQGANSDNGGDASIDANGPTRGREASLNVVRMQLRGMGRGLGTERTVKQFEESLGVDFEKLELLKGCENVGLEDKAFVSSSQRIAGDDTTLSGGKEVAENDMSTVMSLVSQFMGNK
ncbi:hypothetical protein ACHAWT_002065 [Skeletonema menzelii]